MVFFLYFRLFDDHWILAVCYRVVFDRRLIFLSPFAIHICNNFWSMRFWLMNRVSNRDSLGYDLILLFGTATTTECYKYSYWNKTYYTNKQSCGRSETAQSQVVDPFRFPEEQFFIPRILLSLDNETYLKVWGLVSYGFRRLCNDHNLIVNWNSYRCSFSSSSVVFDFQSEVCVASPTIDVDLRVPNLL